MDTENWSYDGKDDCYYYRKSSVSGRVYHKSFDGIKIPKEKDTSSLTETEAFQVYLTEESVQAVHGNEIFKDFKEAWNYYTVQRQGDISEKNKYMMLPVLLAVTAAFCLAQGALPPCILLSVR